MEFEAALILLQKSKINRGDSHEKLLSADHWLRTNDQSENERTAGGADVITTRRCLGWAPVHGAAGLFSEGFTMSKSGGR